MTKLLFKVPGSRFNEKAWFKKFQPFKAFKDMIIQPKYWWHKVG
jgi:hypothetical protein